MTELMRIQPFIRAYVLAISSILEAEVTVVDSDLMRVGGSAYFDGLPERVAHTSFFQNILLTGRPGLIRDVRQESLCAQCETYDCCRELANLAYPIFLDGEAAGVIGIVAIREEEQEKLLRDQDKLEEFLKYMSMLIESKIVTERGKQSLEEQIREVVTAEYRHLRENHFVGRDPKLLEILELARKISRSDSTVLITGESGTGKDVLAKVIHACSPRRDKIMVTVNCGAIPENLVESELFGYEDGAFTGARRGGRPGKFELAHGSTLFLDEVSEMPWAAQTKLLRVLQERTVERLGGGKSISVDVRVVCATNRDLEELVARERFRRDLFFRLNVIPVAIPPLRRRRQDIPLLVSHFIRRYNHVLKKNIRGIDQEAERLFVGYDWPGNVRELKNTIEYLGNIIEGNMIRAADLPNQFFAGGEGDAAGRTLEDMMADYEKSVLRRLTEKVEYMTDKGALARRLGVSRATLYRKLAAHGLR